MNRCECVKCREDRRAQLQLALLNVGATVLIILGAFGFLLLLR